MIQATHPLPMPTFKLGLSMLRPRCHAFVSPQYVVLDMGGRSQPIVVALTSMPVALADQFETAIAKLLQVLDAEGIRGRRLNVVVSDAWARPAALTLPNKAAPDEVVDKMLIEHYRRTYGDLMDGWKWCWARHAQQVVGVAWPAAGLAALRTGLAQRDCVLASAQPLGSEVVNSLSDAPGSRWVVILAGPCVTLMLIQEGKLIDWWVISAGTDLNASLIVRLAREAAHRSVADRAVVIIDLHDESHLASTLKALRESGWSPHLATTKQLEGSMACRLHRLISLQTTT